MTHYQLQQQREFEDQLKAAEAAERDMASRRELSADQYARQVGGVGAGLGEGEGRGGVRKVYHWGHASLNHVGVIKDS